jgi:hypothetical protein
MERVYLILRNNQQTGPFTIDELLQQQLRPSDMVWIEGKSSVWTYLSELELIPFVKDPLASQSNPVLKTEDEIERKAEELRQRVLASARRAYFPQQATEIETYASAYKIPEGELQVIDHRKERNIKRNAVFGEFLLTCIVIGLFVVGIYKGQSFLGAKEKVQNSVATQLDSADQHAAQKTKPVISATVLMPDTTNEEQDSLLALQKEVHKAPVFRKRVIDSSFGSTALNKLALNQDKKGETESSSDTSVESVIKNEDILKKELVPSVPELKTNEAPVKEEKKGFLKGLFKKRKTENSDKAETKN